MLILMLPTKSKFDEYCKMGLVRSQTHNTLPLTIYNYTELASFDRLWNGVTRMARGIVFDDKGRCIIRCIPKFFNSDEPTALLETPKDESFRIFEKLDGSLIQVVNDQEYGLLITSKGSFTSDQAVWAAEILDNIDYDFALDTTYVFELIHPANRIVVDYGGEYRLVLLTAINNQTGQEFRQKTFVWHDTPQEYNLEDMTAIMSKDNFEGVVYLYESGYRTKVKTEEYVRLHRIMTGYSAKTIWESLKDKKPLDLKNMPEEFMKWFDNTKSGLEKAFAQIDMEAQPWIEKANSFELGSEIAEAIKDYEHKSIVWSALKGKDYSDYIWKQLKPKGNTNPFQD